MRIRMQMSKRPLPLCRNKKGVLEISWTELIGALLALLVITGVGYVALRLTGIVLPKKDYDSTIKSFDILGKKIDSLVKDKNYANTELLYFLDPSYILVGFDYKDASTQMKTCDGTFFKGEELMDSRKALGGLCEGACLCVYKNTKANNFDKDLQTPLKCKTFEKNVVFIAPAEQKDIFCSIGSGWNPQSYVNYYPFGSYQFLIMYGANTKNLYIDKYEPKDGNIFIFLAQYNNDKNDPIYKRKLFMEENYEKNSGLDNQK